MEKHEPQHKEPQTLSLDPEVNKWETREGESALLSFVSY